jgi:hypothetical protein
MGTWASCSHLHRPGLLSYHHFSPGVGARGSPVGGKNTLPCRCATLFSLGRHSPRSGTLQQFLYLSPLLAHPVPQTFLPGLPRGPSPGCYGCSSSPAFPTLQVLPPAHPLFASGSLWPCKYFLCLSFTVLPPCSQELRNPPEGPQIPIQAPWARP